MLLLETLKVVKMLNKPFNDITLADVKKLLNPPVVEHQTLEYKSEMYGRSDGQIKELLKDITSIANAYGGDLLIGIAEGRAGIPEKITGIKNGDLERDRIVSICTSSIDPRIPGLQVKCIEDGQGTSIILTRIPRSIRSPHMARYGKSTAYWRRHDRQTSLMSADEIRDAFSRSSNYVEDVKAFLDARKSDILEVARDVPMYVLKATPIPLQSDIFRISDEELRKLLEALPDQRPVAWNFNFLGYHPRPTLEGLELADNNKKLSVFRNGHIEVIMKIEDESFTREVFAPDETTKIPLLFSYPLVEYCVGFIRAVDALRNYLSIAGPFVLSVSLYNIEGYGLRGLSPKAVFYTATKPAIWPRRHLEVPAREVSEIGSDDSLAKEIADLIWQAFHYEEAPLFEDGIFKP